MSATAATIRAFEGAPLPDPVLRSAIGFLVGRARQRLSGAPADADSRFARDMALRAIAEHTEAANAQHYALPPAFFQAVLGPRLKYSSCLYDEGAETLEAAEIRALAETCVHADLADGQTILELGCGWGSLSLWMAERYPNAAITSVSNSAPQRAHIERQARLRGIPNLRVVTADMNDFRAEARFDRIVSVEMFEHMANWRALLERTRTWLEPDGRLFLHVFTHQKAPYVFDVRDTSDWIAQYFFTGGVMPSHGLIRQFPDLYAVEQDWRWSGRHYERTALDWLANFDRNADRIATILQSVYGDEAKLWGRRWRLFFLATAGLFGDRGGSEWGVSHYRLAPA